MEAVERDGSDPGNDDPPHLTGDYRQSPVHITTYSYVEKGVGDYGGRETTATAVVR